MFEDMTYEKILQNVLNRIDDNIDKRQGSIIYDAIAPACAELASAYVKMECVIDNSFADSANREYLVKRAMERGIEPLKATKAIARGVFDVEIDIGKRFSIGEVVFKVTKKICDFEYEMECESDGSIGNQFFGTLIPIEYIENLGYAMLTEILIYARDDEDTEVFRERYFQELNGDSFGGNRNDYYKWVKAISGVGQMRCVRACEEDDNVVVYIMGVNGNKPSNLLIRKVKEALDPSDSSGYGNGIAPIGHKVRVESVKNKDINIAISGSINGDSQLSDVIEEVKSVIQKYFDKVNENWENTNNGIELYSAHIMVEVLNVSGVKNIEKLLINNKNYIGLEENEVLNMGSVNFSIV